MKTSSKGDNPDRLQDLPRVSASRMSDEVLLELLSILGRTQTANLYTQILALQFEVDELTEILQAYQKNIWVSNETFLHILKILAQRKLKERPVQVVKQVHLTPKQYERSFLKLSNFIAAIISHTYLERGDEASFADDEALMMIRDLLLMFDETIMVRNASRRRIAELSKLGYKKAQTG